MKQKTLSSEPMKTITISRKMWRELSLLKIKNNHKNLSETLENLFAQNRKKGKKMLPGYKCRICGKICNSIILAHTHNKEMHGGRAKFIYVNYHLKGSA